MSISRYCLLAWFVVSSRSPSGADDARLTFANLSAITTSKNVQGHEPAGVGSFQLRSREAANNRQILLLHHYITNIRRQRRQDR
jgi:hypothetical protein